MMHTLEPILGYHFKDSALLEEALTHPSISKQHDTGRLFNYERLEFLGDAVLGLVVAELLMERFPHEKEGHLAKRHSALVRGEALDEVARELSIGKYILMTEGEETTGGRTNSSNIENALEAVIGAIYRDSGLEEAGAFIRKHWMTMIEEMKEPPKDPKTALQEWAQGRSLPIPVYTVLSAVGPSHAPEFCIEVVVQGIASVQGSGSTKKSAEKEAALKMLKTIEEQHV